MAEKKVELEIFSDGRPITCPTLRGIRMGLYQCSKAGALCCWGCDNFSQGNGYYYCGYRRYRCMVSFKSFRDWNFRVPSNVCNDCPHYHNRMGL